MLLETKKKGSRTRRAPSVGRRSLACTPTPVLDDSGERAHTQYRCDTYGAVRTISRWRSSIAGRWSSSAASSTRPLHTQAQHRDGTATVRTGAHKPLGAKPFARPEGNTLAEYECSPTARAYCGHHAAPDTAEKTGNMLVARSAREAGAGAIGLLLTRPPSTASGKFANAPCGLHGSLLPVRPNP